MNPLVLLGLLGGAVAVLRGLKPKPKCKTLSMGDWNRVYEQMWPLSEELALMPLPTLDDWEVAEKQVTGYAIELAGAWMTRYMPACGSAPPTDWDLQTVDLRRHRAWMLATLVAIQVLQHRGLLGSEIDAAIRVDLTLRRLIDRLNRLSGIEQPCTDARITEAVGHWPPQLVQLPWDYELHDFLPETRMDNLLGANWDEVEDSDVTTLDVTMRRGIHALLELVVGSERMRREGDFVFGNAVEPFPLFDLAFGSLVSTSVIMSAFGCAPTGNGERLAGLRDYLGNYLSTLYAWLSYSEVTALLTVSLTGHFASVPLGWWSEPEVVTMRSNLLAEHGPDNLDLVARELVAGSPAVDDAEAAIIRQLPVFADFGYQAHRYNEWRGQVDLWATQFPAAYALISAIENEMRLEVGG